MDELRKEHRRQQRIHDQQRQQRNDLRHLKDQLEDQHQQILRQIRDEHRREKREQNIKKLQQGELAPSSVSWGLLINKLNGDIPDLLSCFHYHFSRWIQLCKGVDIIRSMMDLIRNNSVSENEGHSILLCGKILPHIVEEKEKLYCFRYFL